MDEYYASRKRLRASYPSPGNQGSSSTNGFSYPGLPTPDLQRDPAPSPAMSSTPYTQSNALEVSFLSNTTPSKGKRKAMEFVDLTEESGATAPLPKHFGYGDVIDLTDDSEPPAPFSNTSVNRSSRHLSYRVQKIHPQPHPYPPQYPHLQQYPAVYDDPSPYQPYSDLNFGSSSLLHSNTQRYSNPQQYPQPHQYAHTSHGQLPQPSAYLGFSVPPGFEAAYGRLTTGTSNGKDPFDLTPGAQSKLERSSPTHGLVNNSVSDSTDPHQNFSRGHDVNVTYAFDARDQNCQDVDSRAEPPPSSAKRAQEQVWSENGTVDPHAARALLQSWAGKARNLSCSGCRNPMLGSMGTLNMLFKKWVEGPTMNISSVISCEQPWCTANTCLGCGKNCRTAGPASAQIKDTSQLCWCCDAGRMVLLWILLCGADKRKSVRRRRGEYFANLKSSKSRNVSGAGVGYGSHTAYGSLASIPQALSYGVYGHLNNSRVSLPQPAALPTADRADDDVTSRVMACLDNLLPSLATQNASSFDLNPPAHLLAVLTQSSVLGTIAALLRNGSLEDATQRIRLYQNTLNVVDKLSDHPATADLTVNQSRQESSSPTDILSLSYLDPDGNNTDKYEETDSLSSCLHNLDMASKSILARAKAHPHDFVGQDSDEMLSLCKRVSSTADFILATNAKRSPSLPEQPATATPKTNNDWQSEMAVLELEDDVIMTRHTHASEAQSANNVVGGRMKSLSIQLSNLTTSVPPGVFVRYCSSRLDVMKILIIGPKGTPYENGLFEFDLFCPPQFPNVPPKMKFRTTGGGRVRFNPNLYNDGKVCLSLLGTWAGPSWLPGKSTILQILVSIQAMIFCDEPWYNEPGRVANAAASKAHNRELQGHTVRHAMLNWLKPGVDSVWADVVQKHFETSAQSIQLMVAQWEVDSATQVELREAVWALEKGRSGGRMLGVLV